MSMRRLLAATALAAALLVPAATPAMAITGGQPDGDGHPYEALLLVPGTTFCSGTLIAPTVILTAGHCTDFWTNPGDAGPINSVMVSFAPQAEVDADWNPVHPEDWHVASSWVTHPDYDGDAWPLTWDYGLLFLDEPVDITPAQLPEVGALDAIIDNPGQTDARFSDVGYGQNGVLNGGGQPVRNFTWTRKVSVQRYAPGNGSVSGVFHPAWFILGSNPSSNHGGGCGGDSGSGIFPTSGPDADTVVAVHVGGYRMGYHDRLCGRITALNMRTDIASVQAWIAAASAGH
jgi:hypothetical protein